MQLDHFSFGTIRIDGSTREHDVVIDRGEVRKRKKGPSKLVSDAFGHTPLSIEEEIPRKCRQLDDEADHRSGDRGICRPAWTSDCALTGDRT